MKISKRNGKFGYDGRINGKRHRDYRFLARADAARAWSTLLSKKLNEDYEWEVKRKQATVQQAVEEYISRYTVKAKTRGYKYQNSTGYVFSMIKDFAQFVGPDTPIASLTTKNMHEWAAHMHRTPATLGAYAKRISGMLRLAKETLPGLGSWRMPAVREYAQGPNTARARLITSSERTRLIEILLSPTRVQHEPITKFKIRQIRWRDSADIVRIAMATGMRADEIQRLFIKDVQQASSRISVTGTKTGYDRSIPLPPVVVELLDARTKEGLTDSKSFFPGRYCLKNYYGVIRSSLARACKEAGLPYGRAGEGFTLHDARATYITSLLRGDEELGIRPISIGTVMRYSGHHSLEAFQKYIRIIEDEERTAIEASQALVTKGLSAQA